MKIKLLFYLCLISLNSVLAQPGTLILEGNYMGKNIYIQNPYNESGDGFCTKEVRVNGIKMLQSTNSTAYEIRLDSLNFKLYDSVRVVITHENNCTPKVLNYDHGPTNPTFVIDTIYVDSTGLLKWKTKNENGMLMYTIEEFRWNKWIPAGEMGGKGLISGNEYEFQSTPHSGINKLRVKQVDRNGIPRYSHVVTFTSIVPEVKLKSKRVKDKIEFSDFTRFELYDAHGNMVKRGNLKEIDCKNLKKGAYFLNFDSTETEIIISRK